MNIPNSANPRSTSRCVNRTSGSAGASTGARLDSGGAYEDCWPVWTTVIRPPALRDFARGRGTIYETVNSADRFLHRRSRLIDKSLRLRQQLIRFLDQSGAARLVVE